MIESPSTYVVTCEACGTVKYLTERCATCLAASYDSALERLVMARKYMSAEAQEAFDAEWKEHRKRKRAADSADASRS